MAENPSSYETLASWRNQLQGNTDKYIEAGIPYTEAYYEYCDMYELAESTARKELDLSERNSDMTLDQYLPMLDRASELITPEFDPEVQEILNAKAQAIRARLDEKIEMIAELRAGETNPERFVLDMDMGEMIIDTMKTQTSKLDWSWLFKTMKEAGDSQQKFDLAWLLKLLLDMLEPKDARR